MARPRMEINSPEENRRKGKRNATRQPDVQREESIPLPNAWLQGPPRGMRMPDDGNAKNGVELGTLLGGILSPMLCNIIMNRTAASEKYTHTVILLIKETVHTAACKRRWTDLLVLLKHWDWSLTTKNRIFRVNKGSVQRDLRWRRFARAI